jgi:hypothetical protein
VSFDSGHLKKLQVEDVVGWMRNKVEKYFDAGVVCKEEDQIPSTNYGFWPIQ